MHKITDFFKLNKKKNTGALEFVPPNNELVTTTPMATS